MFEPGTIMEDESFEQYGKHTFTRYTVTASVVYDTDRLSCLNHFDSGDNPPVSCPVCGSEVTSFYLLEEDAAHIRVSSRIPYCKDCDLAFKRRSVGYVDERDEYHSLV